MEERPKRLDDPAFWHAHLGLLPVPLTTNARDRRFVLLNGSAGNFCLDATDEAEREGRSLAWSCDVGHFVAVEGDYLSVQQWNRRERLTSKFRIDDVASRLREFHRFLEQSEPNRDQSIVAHGVRVLGQLRALVSPSTSPETVIQLFLRLLASAVDEKPPLEIDLAKWRLDESASDISNLLRKEDWFSLRRELVESRPVSELRPHIELLLRHASVPLFQEAHYQIYQSPVMTLPGILPAPARAIRTPILSSLGVFFTPPALARAVVEETLNALGSPLPSSLRIFDPSCGSGEFLKEAIRQLELRNYTGELKLLGWDLLPVPVQMSRFCFAFENLSQRAFSIEWNIEQTNSLMEPVWPQNFDAIITNPPFAALQFLDPELKRIVRETTSTKGRPNLAAAFLMRAAKCVRRGGVLGAIIPSSITDAESGSSVRAELSKEFEPRLIAKLGYQAVFSNSLVDAGIYVGIRGHDIVGKRTRVLWADHQPESISEGLRELRMLSTNDLYSEVVDTEQYSVYPSAGIGRSSDSWSPKPYRSISLLNSYSSLPKLDALFHIRQGVRVGHDDLLQPDSFVRTLPKREQKFFRPAVVNATLRNSQILAGMSVWYPYSPGLPKLGSERDLQLLVPNFYEQILLPARPRLRTRARTNPESWWNLAWPRSWQFKQEPKIVTAYFGGAGSVAFDQSGEYVVVVGHAWLPRSKSTPIEADVANAYVALAASELFNKLLEACSVHVGGGQLSLEHRFLMGMPVPDLAANGSIPPRLIRRLSQIGRTLAKGSTIDRNELEETVLNVYSSGGL
jgi:adenine-specific DNA-methyltransferase